MTKNLPAILVQFALFLGAALAITCTEPSSVECPSGRVCPVGTVCAAAQDVCIANGCGDSVTDPGEVCDDGNVRDGDGCSADCESDETCGNDTTDTAADEVCDDGNTNDDDGCSADCKSNELCGNGITDTAVGEVCDDHNTDSADGCRGDCISDETCGNGETDTDVGEACDDGNTMDGDGCSSDCTASAGCGNGFVDEGEICDDHNQVDDDGCSANCLSDETCGNDTIDFAAGEVCDDANTDSGDGCRSDCHSDETCGNDELDSDPGVDPDPEQCDDGGNTDGDGCSALCQLEVCGNGVLDDEFGEACDDGNTSDGLCVDDPTLPACAVACPVGDECAAGFFCSDITGLCDGLDACSHDCQSGNDCGNGVRDATEECDDGDTTFEDDCIVGEPGTIRCTLARCGDGYVDLEPANVEDCDGDGDGDGGQTADCNLDCTDAVCGDGVINPLHIEGGFAEQCDSSGESAFCDDDCTIAFCGDGVTNGTAGEDCDSSGVNTSTCNADCTFGGPTGPICGDGHVNPAADPDGGGPLTGEQCDDSGTSSFDGCSSLCQTESSTLTVGKVGTGTGTVTANVGVISCGSSCSETYLPSQSVILSVTPGTNSAFTGWSGGGCSGTGTCTVSMATSVNVVAVFDTNRLTIAKTGNGTGGVTTDVGGINCGATCFADYDNNTVVTLTAAPVANSTFTGWSGVTGTGCTGTGTCATTMTGAKTATANFQLKTLGLTITKAGNGASIGSVVSSPAGITCGATCSNTFNQDSTVTLTATPGANSVFSGWSGTGVPAACTGGSLAPCNVTMDVAKAITATFTLNTHQLAVVKSGTGGGSVAGVSTPTQTDIACGAACALGYTAGTSVVLTATQNTGSTFTGWTVVGAPACAGITPCTVVMNNAVTVTANFNVDSYNLTLTPAGTGSGVVTSSPSGISCGGTCSAPFTHGTVVSLTPVANAGSLFTGWGGSCSGTGACNVTMDAAKNVSATFTTLLDMTVTKAGTGTGTVTSSTTTPTGQTEINCGTACTRTFRAGSVVTLTAAIGDVNQTFAGWGGAAASCGTTTTCPITMDAVKSVTATFNLVQRQLSTTIAGTGTVTLSPGGATCSTGTCNNNFNHGTLVTLTAAAGAGFQFTGWSGTGGCTGTGACILTMDAAKAATATFAAVFDFNVLKAGTGSGTVTSVTTNPTGQAELNCGSTCTRTFFGASTVTLTATPTDANSTFNGWSGVTGTGCTLLGTCAVTVDAAKTATATFIPTPRTLTTTVVGNGTVTSAPAVVNCSDTNTPCANNFSHGTSVALFAAPKTGYVFTGWSGTGGCTGTGACVLTMDAAKAATATFTQTFTVTVTKAGNGTGIVTSTSSPVQTDLNCGTSCARDFTSGTVVTLSASPLNESQVFTGWSGTAGCTGNGACVLTMSAAKAVTATFTKESAAPTATITAPTSADTFITNVSPLTTLAGTATDNVQVATVTWSNGAPSGGSGSASGTTSWTVPTITLQPGSNPITVTATDLVGNIGTDLITITYDPSSPTVTINQDGAQADPINAQPINFAVVFSESVTGFTGSDVTLSGTAAGLGTATKTVTGSGAIYNVAVSGLTGGGTVIATIPAGGAQDAASNNNVLSTSTDNSVTFDNTNPSVTVNQAGGQADPTDGTINFAVVFSEATTDFAGADVTLSGTAGLGSAVKNVTGSGTTYNVAVTGVTTSGTVIATISAGGAHDAAGNGNTVSTSTDNTVSYDNTNPTAAITVPDSDGDFTTTNATEALGGTAADDVAVTSVTWVNAANADSGTATGTTAWSVAAVTLAAGANVITVTSLDAAGNTGTAVITITQN